MKKTASPRRIGTRYGVWIGLALVLLGFVYRVADLDRVAGFTWLFYLALPVGALIAQIRFRSEGGALSLRQGLTIVALITLIASPIYCLYVWSFNQFIDDSLLDRVVAGRREALADRGLSGESLEDRLETFAVRLTPATFAFSVMIQLVGFGLISGALITLLTKTRRWRTPQTPP